MHYSGSKKNWIIFLITMFLFTTGMVLMIFFDISDLWLWSIFLIVWTWVEVEVSKRIYLPWWVWLLLTVGIIVIDWIILSFLF
jgi:hypothetical protein